MFKTIFDNRWFQRLLLPVAIFNMLASFTLTMKEFRLIKESINSNDEFYKAIATLGFSPNKWLPELVSILPIQDKLTIDEVRDIANTNIIAIILQFVKSEQLLGIITVKCDIIKNNVVIFIQPKTLQILIIDIYDTIVAIMFTAIISALVYVLLFNF